MSLPFDGGGGAAVIDETVLTSPATDGPPEGGGEGGAAGGGDRPGNDRKRRRRPRSGNPRSKGARGSRGGKRGRKGHFRENKKENKTDPTSHTMASAFNDTSSIAQTPHPADAHADVALIDVDSSETVNIRGASTPIKNSVTGVVLKPENLSSPEVFSTPRGGEAGGAHGGARRKIMQPSPCTIDLFDRYGQKVIKHCQHNPKCVYGAEADDTIEFERAFDKFAESRRPAPAYGAKNDSEPTPQQDESDPELTLNLDESESVTFRMQKPTLSRICE